MSHDPSRLQHDAASSISSPATQDASPTRGGAASQSLSPVEVVYELTVGDVQAYLHDYYCNEPEIRFQRRATLRRSLFRMVIVLALLAAMAHVTNESIKNHAHDPWVGVLGIVVSGALMLQAGFLLQRAINETVNYPERMEKHARAVAASWVDSGHWKFVRVRIDDDGIEVEYPSLRLSSRWADGVQDVTSLPAVLVVHLRGTSSSIVIPRRALAKVNANVDWAALLTSKLRDAKLSSNSNGSSAKSGYPAGSQCPACRYTLEGVIDEKCPECGLRLDSWMFDVKYAAWLKKYGKDLRA